MAYKTDIEIARDASKKPIQDIGAKLGIGSDDLLPYGHDKAKVSQSFIDSVQGRPNGKLVLVTAINPTPAGEGKTTTTVGLGDGLNRIGKNACVCIREASLGPNFGMKGGAAGGGMAQVVPMEDMNLHFTGDFHAITSAHNLLAAMMDNHVYWGNVLEIDIRRVAWRRVLDMNDRALRQINVNLGGVANGFPREGGFDITVASEVMAILWMKMNGGVAKADLGAENVAAVEAGCANLGRHIGNLKSFGVPVVVAINHFVTDTDAEVQAVKDYVATQGSEAVLSQHWEFGSKGSEALAQKVAEVAESGASNFAPIYPDDMGLFDKIDTIAKQIYHADDVIADQKIRNQLKDWEEQGYGNLPICMAKTQYSFTTDPTVRGAPTGHSVPVREVRLSAGAGFIVVICGEIMTMPGLPRVPSAEAIHLNDAGQIEGLF